MQSGWLHQFLPKQPEKVSDVEPKVADEASAARSVSRRDFLQSGAAAGMAAGLTAGSLLNAEQKTAEAAPTATTPLGDPWWPSRWGADDQAGASNWITPAKVLEACSMIRTGKIYEIGRVYEAAMPLFGSRVFGLRIPGTPTGGPFGENKLVYHDEFLAAEIGQVGTQFDGLGHIGCQVGAPGDLANMRYYNGITGLEMADPNGLKKLGMEHVKPFFTRAVLADIAGHKGRMLNMGEEVTLADVLGALSSVGISGDSIRPGDGVFFNTGWGNLWMQDNTRFNSGEPGIGMEVARWLAEKQVAVVGADTWATEVVPNPDPSLVFAVHNELITKHGIFNHENLNFDALIADGVYEFVYVFAPLRIKGATGSPGRPIAIV